MDATIKKSLWNHAGAAGILLGLISTVSMSAGQFFSTLNMSAILNSMLGLVLWAAETGGCIYLMQQPDEIMRCFKRAVTDSDTGRCVYYDVENKPGVANLMQIYSCCTGKSFEEIERDFEGKGYGAFKPAVGEAVVEMLRPVREEAERLMKDKAYLESIYRDGAERASRAANRTLGKVYKKLGFVSP